MPFKKTNEAYFGDSFNRGSVLCYASACNSSDSATFTANNVEIDYDALANLTNLAGYDLSIGADKSVFGYACTKGDAVGVTQNYVTMDNFNDLAARIAALEQTKETKKGADKLRCALKTLNYTREIQ